MDFALQLAIHISVVPLYITLVLTPDFFGLTFFGISSGWPSGITLLIGTQKFDQKHGWLFIRGVKILPSVDRYRSLSELRLFGEE